MLNAVNLNLVAFWRYLEPNLVAGQVFALFVITVAAAEAAVGLAMIIAIYRSRLTVNADEVDTLKGYEFRSQNSGVRSALRMT